MAFDLDPNYKQVPERIADFKEKHPDGCLRPANPDRPFWFEQVGDQMFVCYVAAAYRSPDDPCPGIGAAWEPVPGKTPYTKLSELQNAETSAWGRAIVAVLASESKSVASAEDVRNRRADHAEPDVAACSDCGELVEGARSDKEPMRVHKVTEHGWVRNEDGTVAPPKDTTKREAAADGSDSDGDAAVSGDGADSHDVGRSEPEAASRRLQRAEQVAAENGTSVSEAQELAARAAALADKKRAERPEDEKVRAAGGGA